VSKSHRGGKRPGGDGGERNANKCGGIAFVRKCKTGSTVLRWTPQAIVHITFINYTVAKVTGSGSVDSQIFISSPSSSG